jgi:THO complex subunit 2
MSSIWRLYKITKLSTINLVDMSNSDHNAAVEAVFEGLKKRKGPSFFIHTTGAVHFYSPAAQLDVPVDKEVSDIKNLQEFRNLPIEVVHGPTDKLVQSYGGKYGINVALIDPAVVYGRGLGPIKKSGLVLEMLIDVSLKNKQVVQWGQGRARISAVHVIALGEFFNFLIEEAVKGGGKAQWNEEGWYIGANDTIVSLVSNLVQCGHA